MWKEVEQVLLALFSLRRRDGLRVKIRGLVGEVGLKQSPGEGRRTDRLGQIRGLSSSIRPGRLLSGAEGRSPQELESEQETPGAVDTLSCRRADSAGGKVDRPSADTQDKTPAACSHQIIRAPRWGSSLYCKHFTNIKSTTDSHLLLCR